MKNVIIIFLVFACLFYSCKEEKDVPPIANQKIAQFDVIILNEGNFQWGQGTVSMYDSRSREVIDKVFQANNNQRPLGDVAQSMTFKGDTAFIVINNSNKIEVVDLKTFKSIGQIEGLESPRNMLIINKNKAYVSDLYENQIYIVDPEKFNITGRIASNGWTEEMVLHDGKIFVCQIDSNQLYVIDAQTDQLLKKIPTASSPQYLEVDKNGAIWLSCSGGLNADTAAIQKINSRTLTVEKSFYAKDHNANYMELAINQAADQLCVLGNEGLFQFSIHADEFPSIPIIKNNGRNFYAMNINPQNDEIYICDAMDYQQKGLGYRYNWNGKEIDHFRIGIIPGAIYFP